MRNLKIGLTDEQRAARKIGGSAAGKIMAGNPAELIALWEEMTGARQPEDLTNVLPVIMGSWTEELNRFWYEKQTGREITREGESLSHATYQFMTCTLDGMTTTAKGAPALFEAKHVGGFEPIDNVVARYQPQVHHSMHVAGVEWAILSIFIGNRAWEMFEVQCDQFYLAQLIDRERAFWRCVETGEPPAAMPEVAPPALPTKLRTVDMTGNNAWASSAIDWLASQAAAKTFEAASKELKALVAPDVGVAFGNGIEIKRAKNGALSIKAEKAVKEAA
jgi:predicted phage-related endonuclease